MYTSQTNLSMIFSPSKNLIMLSSVFTYLLRRKVFHSSGNLIAEGYQILQGQRCRVFPGRPSVFQKLPKVTIWRVFDNNKQRPWKKKIGDVFAQQLVRVRNAIISESERNDKLSSLVIFYFSAAVSNFMGIILTRALRVISKAMAEKMSPGLMYFYKIN